jgi:hypothetical protein
MNVWLRVIAVVIMIFTPSILFILFVRFLDSLRDDQLVDRVLDRMDESGSPRGGPATVLTGGMVESGSSRLDGSVTVCSSCGEPNPGFARYCGHCTSRLDAGSG